jgi:hypothetical protein
MRQSNRRQVLRMGTAATALALLGADRPKGKASPLGGDKKKKEVPLKQDETVGDLARLVLYNEIRVEGVGLVVGLDGTGAEPQPGVHHQKLLGLMRAAQVPNPERILASKDTAMVIVRASIPPGVTREDRFDATLELQKADGTTSLAGGVLLQAELGFVGVADGRVLEGKVLAKAQGPVLAGSIQDPDDLRSGRVLGGVRVREDMPYQLVLRENHQGARTVMIVEAAIGARFFYLDGPNQKGMAQSTRSDEMLILRVPRIYHQNQDRYFKVIQRLPVIDTPELRARRLEKWGAELLDPKTAGEAALRLEGLGSGAVPALKKGLEGRDPMVRYFASEALAYLNDDSGAEVLAAAVVAQPEFRAFALAAMAATDQPGSLTRLRELMSHPDREVRYGAFNALRSADPMDVSLGRVAVIEAELPQPEDDQDAMAYQIAVQRALANRRPDPFELYLVDCDGPPMVHVANTRRAEIVVFGRRQKLLTPVVLGGSGSILLNAGLQDETVQVARISSATLDAPDQTVSCPRELGEVIRAMANLGAPYPEIVRVLQGASQQANLEGPLVIDAVPGTNPEYDRAQLAGVKPGRDGEAKKDEAVGKAGAEKAEPRRRGLFNRLRRDP